MNLSTLKKFAQEMRRDFMAQVSARLDYVLTHDDEYLRAHAAEKRAIIERMNKLGDEALVEEAAYLWFNRLAAFRYMDARGFTSPRIVSPRPGETQPELLSDIKSGRIPPSLQHVQERFDGLLSGRIRSGQPDREVYKEALLATCNAWAASMPWLFKKVDDWAGLLLPQDILSPDSLVVRMVEGLPEEDCAQGVEIIGWLYQFYISEKKDEVFAALKKNVKITKENIPAATQLFTPHWIVRFMVENSLGRLWLLNHPESRLRERMKYYVQSDPEPDFLRVKDPAEIKCLDPCCGSGHILAYFFELLYAMYEEEGYAPQEIPSLIVQNNIFGIDIDERAAELAAFTVAMVAREKDRRFFERGVVPHVIAMNDIQVDLRRLNVRLSPDLQESVELLKEGRNYGSLIPVPAGAAGEIAEVERALAEHRLDSLFDTAERDDLTAAFRILEYLEPRYHVVVTNPPYMGYKGMNETLKSYLGKAYAIAKSDLFSAFIDRVFKFTIEKGYSSVVTMQSWMFLSSFEELRKKILETKTIISMVHMDNMVMHIAFGTAAVVFKNQRPPKDRFEAQYCYVEMQDISNDEPKQFPVINSRFKKADQRDFEKIPGSPIAYWVSKNIIDIFIKSQPLASYAEPRQGMATTDNNKFLRIWPEVSNTKICFNNKSLHDAKFSKKKWFPYNKGGEYRKWYGNNSIIVNYYNDGEELKNIVKEKYRDRTYAQGFSDAKWDKLIEIWVLKNQQFYFKSSVTWTFISSAYFAARFCNSGFIFDVGGSSIFPNNNEITAFTSFLCSNVCNYILKLLNPTLNFQVENIAALPILYSKFKNAKKIIMNIANTSISISKSDWDLRETSWDFRRSPLLTDYTAPRIETVIDENLTDWSWPSAFAPGAWIKLRDQAESFKRHWTELFLELHRNEEENNCIFIDLYGLQDELSPEVPYTEITILQDELVESARRENRIEFDESVLARQFVSYGVGCLMGRYSVEQDGLILADAGATLDDFRAKVPNARFLPDPDAILPLTDEEDFPDDLPTAFKAWLRFISGEHYEDNLRWLEDRLGKDLRSYFIRDFYKEHVRRYKNRPIYWMVSSPSGAFRALIYLHRYTKDSVGKLLNDYLRPYRTKLEQKLRSLAAVIDDTSSTQSEKTKARKRYAQLQKYLAEIDHWEQETVYPLAQKRIEIDLDDGVKVNYRKFAGLLEPIKQLEAKEEE